MKAYLKRKHPVLYRRLAADVDILNFVSALRSYRTKDRWLAGLNAGYLHMCWREAMPNSRTLGLEPKAQPKATSKRFDSKLDSSDMVGNQ